jgi:tripartite-type tricarboxylate transporter receptor subunit TctC
MVVSSKNPYRSVQDVIQAIKQKSPEAFTYSSNGIGSSMHIAGVMFGNLSKTQLTHVPFTSAPAAMTAILAGDIDMGFFNIPAAKGLIDSGELRPLAMISIKRSATLPDIPTINDGCGEGLRRGHWIGFIAPAGTPLPVVTKLDHALIRSSLSQLCERN